MLCRSFPGLYVGRFSDLTGERGGGFGFSGFDLWVMVARLHLDM